MKSNNYKSILATCTRLRCLKQFVSPKSLHFSTKVAKPIVDFSFIEGKEPNIKINVKGEIGSSVLDVALDHNIDIEGACGGELACSTCHVILSPELYNKLPKKSEEEQDMLDLAWGLEPTSRLCCQIKVTEDLKDAVFKVPTETNNML